MSQPAQALHALPPAVATALRKLGADLATARQRRRQPLKAWAQRLQVSVPTLMRMEKGDARVSMAVYATALWLVNRHAALAEAAEPRLDLAALEAEVAQAQRRHAPRVTSST